MKASTAAKLLRRVADMLSDVPDVEVREVYAGNLLMGEPYSADGATIWIENCDEAQRFVRTVWGGSGQLEKWSEHPENGGVCTVMFRELCSDISVFAEKWEKSEESH